MSTIACIAVPRFALVAACGQDRTAKEAIALTRGAGGNALVVEVSRGAEVAGVRRGMSRAQAAGRTGDLRLAAPDPGAEDDLWAGVIRRLETIGAEVESDSPGQAYFYADGLRGLHGGTVGRVLAAAIRAAAPLRVRAAAAPSRFAAYLAAVGERGTFGFDGDDLAPVIADDGERVVNLLSPLGVGSLAVGPGLPEKAAAELVKTLERVGVATLGRFAELGADQVADRLGPTGLRALEMATGLDRKLEPRPPIEELREDLDFPDGAGAGVQLENGLRIVIRRMLGQPIRKGRTILAIRLLVRFAVGGSWETSQTFGTATESELTISSLLMRRLEDLPSVPASLSLRVTAFGPPPADQLSLSTEPFPDEARLDERIGQLRSLQGEDVILGIENVEPDSRIPERRIALVPYVGRKRRRRR
jgi:protein ImuB